MILGALIVSTITAGFGRTIMISAEEQKVALLPTTTLSRTRARAKIYTRLFFSLLASQTHILSPLSPPGFSLAPPLPLT